MCSTRRVGSGLEGGEIIGGEGGGGGGGGGGSGGGAGGGEGGMGGFAINVHGVLLDGHLAPPLPSQS